MLFSLLFVSSIIIAVISLIHHKLTFWSRQGIPNDLSSRSGQPFHISDTRSHLKYAKIVGFYEGLRPCLSITDNQIIKKVLITEFHKFANHKILPGYNELFIKALFFLPYPQWKRVRAILSPSFSTIKLKALKPLISQSLDELIKQLESKAGNCEIIDLREYFDNFTFDVISKCAFGLNLNTVNNPENAIFKSAKKFFQINITLKKLVLFVFPKLNKFIDLYFFDRESQQTIAINIKKVIKERIDKNIRIIDVLQLLIDSSELSDQKSNQPLSEHTFERLTEDEIVAQSLNFLGAGYETTSTQLCFISQLLALNPNHQNRLYNEIIDNFNDESDIDYEKLMKMSFLDAFLKESMRIHNSVNRIERITVSDCVIDNMFIPKDTLIVIPIWALHMDPDYYEEPNEFRPQRFLPENQRFLKEYSYLPFATGPRNCIGMRFAIMEIKYLLVRILMVYKFDACDQTNELEFFKLNQVANMKQLMVRIVKRNTL